MTSLLTRTCRRRRPGSCEEMRATYDQLELLNMVRLYDSARRIQNMLRTKSRRVPAITVTST